MSLRHFLWSVYFAIAFCGVLIVSVFLTGNTFGQRCAKLWPENSPAWENCVARFASGPRNKQ